MSDVVSTLNPFDDEDGPFQGSGDADAARNKAGWDSVYAANRALGPAYMDQYGNAADARLGSIQQAGMESSSVLSNEARNMGMSSGNQAAQIGMAAGQQAYGTGQSYGADAAAFGHGAAQSLVDAGGNAAQLGLQGRQTAAVNAAGVGHVANQALAAGQQAQQLGEGYGQTVASYGSGAAWAGQEGADAASRDAKYIQGAARGGQQALSTLGTNVGQVGAGIAGQGQSFLGERGYQANVGDANAARGAAQGAAGQLAGIEATESPSAAQAQLRSGLNQAQSANLAMARSGKGFGGSASALGQAQTLNAQAGQQAVNASAQLRAQENAAFRQRQAANLGTAAGVQLGAGQQALTREQMLGQQQQVATESNRNAYLQSQGLGLNALGQQIGAEAQGRQMALQGQQSAAQTNLAGSQMALAGQQAGGQLATSAGQLGLQGAQVGMQGLGLGMEGYNSVLQGNLAGSQLALQGANADIGARNAAAQQGLAGILGGGNLALEGTTAGGQLALGGTVAGGNLALQGNEQAMQGVGQAAQIGLSAEQQRAANTQYSYGLTQAEIANDLQIAGMQAGLNVQNAGFTNQMAGGVIGAVGQAGAGLAAMSDVNAKTDIVPLGGTRYTHQRDANSPVEEGYFPPGHVPQVLSPEAFNAFASERAGQIGSDYASQARSANMIGMTPRAGADPYGIEFSADQAEAKDAAAKKERTDKFNAFSSVGSAFGQGMGGGLDTAVNPITGQPWAMSDERAKYSVSDKKAKAGEMVDKLDPYAFKYKDPGRHGAGQHIGIMAQDLEKSEAGRTVVEEGPDGLKRVNTPKLTMLNSAALAQYDDRLAEIEARVKRLGGKAA